MPNLEPVTEDEEGLAPRRIGRPKGSKNKITLLKQELELQLREQAAPRIAEVLDRAIEMALQGDRTMIKLLLEMHMAKGSGDDSKVQNFKPEIHINGLESTRRTVSVIDAVPVEVPEDARPDPSTTVRPVNPDQG